MVSRSCLFCVLGALIIASCSDQPVTSPNGTSTNFAQATEVDRVFADIGPESPGAAVAIVRNGAIAYSKGYGVADLEHNVPITSSSVFYIGSVSKQFVTFSILLLWEQGKLSLDDDIRKFIPEFPDYGHTITLRHFIHHTSGVRDYLELWYFAGRSYLDHVPKEAAFDMIVRQKELNFEPGTRYMYSNSCYFLLAVAVERITGKTMDEFAREEIFDPLGMENTRFHDDNRQLISDRAFSYRWNGDRDAWDNLISRFDLVGSGGMYSTVEDLYKWDQNFYRNMLGDKSQALIDTMQTDGKLNDGSSAGYAFALSNDSYRGKRIIGHSGSLAGYRSNYTRFPDDSTSIIILGNFAGLDPIGRSKRIADILFEGALDPVEASSSASKNDPEENVTDFEPIEVSVLAGRYYSGELDTHYDLLEEDGELFVKVAYDPKMKGEQRGDLRFDFGGVTMRFEKESGRVSGFRLDAGRVQNLWFEKM